MVITISVFSMVMLVFMIHTITEHLFNWWIRDVVITEHDTLAFILVVFYILKLGGTVAGLYMILS
jgi:hypothetical protein